MYPFSCGFLCERDILLVRDREEDMETDSYVFFSETSTSQHHNVVLQHTHFHIHTHTHTHDWPTVADRSSGSRYFSGFANIFGPQVVSKNFLDRQGVMQHTKILSSES